MTSTRATEFSAVATQRKKRPANDELFRLLVEGVNDYAIFLLSPEGIVTTWNAGAARMKCYAPEEVIGRHFSIFYPEADRAADMPGKALRTAAREGKYEAEGWRVRKDGTPFWAGVVVNRLLDSEGGIVGFAKITRDLSKRRAAEEALRQSEMQFGMLVQGVTDYAIYMLDPTGHVSSWNAGGERIKGYAQDEILHRHFSTFYTEEDLAEGKPQRALETAAREGRYEAEGWRVRKDGSRFWANVVIDAIRGANGELLGFAKVTRDLTEKRAAEERLRQAQKMEAIGQLTSGVAHDFNNLLGVISGNADLLARPGLDDKARQKLIEGIHRAADRGAKLTQQLLAFARRQPLRPRTHSVRMLIGDFEAVLSHAAGGSEVRLDLGTDPDFTNIDGPQFEAALLNLVINARDAMPSGGTVTIRTAVERVETPPNRATEEIPPGEYVVLTVEDTGVGMAPDILARAIEPFYTTKETGKGSGLGLSQVYGFVRQSGGRVLLDSTPGKGTRVTLYLPTEAAARQPAAKHRAPRGEARRQTVLVVDDDPDVLETTVGILASLGCDVLTARDGVAALDSLRREQRIDALFTDVVMPRGVSGVDLARLARDIRPDIKILLASGFPMSALSAEHGLTSEFAFVSKPYRWTELSERLRSLRAPS